MTRLLQGLTALVGVLMVLVITVNVGAFAGRREWLSLTDRERWDPVMVERRSRADHVVERMERADRRVYDPCAGRRRSYAPTPGVIWGSGSAVNIVGSAWAIATGTITNEDPC